MTLNATELEGTCQTMANASEKPSPVPYQSSLTAARFELSERESFPQYIIQASPNK